jgi:hypothetical protein
MRRIFAAAIFLCALMASAVVPNPASAISDTDHRYPGSVSAQHYDGDVPTRRVRARGKGAIGNAQILPHPAGCPRSLFCGCGVSAKVYGTPVRKLYPSSAWLKFPSVPRSAATGGMVGWYPGHVAYIEQVHGDGTATLYDPNSGQGLTRRHRVPLKIFHKIVNPQPGLAAVKPVEAPPVQPAPIQLASVDPSEMLSEEPREKPIYLSDRDIAIAEGRAYLRKVATAGGTMWRQGRDSVMTRLKATVEAPNLISAFKQALAKGEVRDEGIATSIDRLHPDYVLKLTAALKDARANGLPEARPFSCYRPPEYGVGGMRDKSESCHAYGLVCDMIGIGWARSSDSNKWARIAVKAGLYRPHRSAWEHNHWQLVPQKTCGTIAMRATITRAGPKDLEAMWQAGSKLAAAAVRRPYAEAISAAKKKRYAKKKRRHHRAQYAMAGR